VRTVCLIVSASGRRSICVCVNGPLGIRSDSAARSDSGTARGHTYSMLVEGKSAIFWGPTPNPGRTSSLRLSASSEVRSHPGQYPKPGFRRLQKVKVFAFNDPDVQRSVLMRLRMAICTCSSVWGSPTRSAIPPLGQVSIHYYRSKRPRTSPNG